MLNKVILLITLFTSSLLCAQGGMFTDQVANQKGVPIPNVNVILCAFQAVPTPPCTNPVNIYTDTTLSTQVVNNTTSTDSNGNYMIYAPVGLYIVEVSGQGIAPTDRIIQISATTGSNVVFGSVGFGSITGDAVASGQMSGAQLLANGPTGSCNSGQTAFGGTVTGCTAPALSSGSGPVTLCLVSCVGGSQYLIPLYATSGGTSSATATLTASPSTITGGSSTLTWTSSGASTCVGNGFATGNAPSGSVAVSPTVTTTYSINCNGGVATAIVTFGGSITDSLTTSASTIVYGGSATLTWASSGAGSCTGTNFSTSGTTSGTASVSPTSNTTYTVTCGGVQATTSVAVSILPIPPGNATVYGNLQKTTSIGTWQPCVGSCSGSSGSGTNTLTQGISTPSLSGSSMSVTSTGGGYNTMYYKHLGCGTLPGGVCTGVTNFIDDFYFFVPTSMTGQIQALEFDPQLYPGNGYKLSMSTQCDSNTGKWRFWNQAVNGWVTQAAYSCNLYNSQLGTWHHYQLYATINQSTMHYQYQTLVIDGSPVFINLGTDYAGTNVGFGANIAVQQQVDIKAAQTGATVYYDQYTFTAW